MRCSHLISIGFLILVPLIAPGQTVDDVWFELDGSASPRELGLGVSGTSTNSYSPFLALSPEGTLYLSWHEHLGQYTRDPIDVYVRRWNGVQWEEVGEGSATDGGISNSPGWSLQPRMAFGLNGEPIIAYSDDSDGDAEIYVNRWNGQAWVEFSEGSASGPGISDSAGDARYHEMEVNEQGFPIIVWEQQYEVTSPEGSTSLRDIQMRCWDGSQWSMLGFTSGTAGGISNDGSSRSPSLALDSEGNPLVSWTTRSGNSPVRVARWTGVEWDELGSDSGGVAPDLTIAGGSRVFFGSEGDPHVLFASDEHLHLRRWNGESWEHVIEPQGGDEDKQDFWDMDLSPDGGIFLADSDPLFGEITASRWSGLNWSDVSAGSGTGSGISETMTHSSSPNLEFDSEGMPVIAWREQVSESGVLRNEIFVRRWNGDVWSISNPWEYVGHVGILPAGVTASNRESYNTGLVARSDNAPLVLWWETEEGTVDNFRMVLRAREWTGDAWQDLGQSVFEYEYREIDFCDIGVALDSSGQPWVLVENSYTVANIRHWNGSEWSDDGIPPFQMPAPIIGLHICAQSQLTIDGEGRPTVVYLGSGPGSDTGLHYYVRRWESGEWKYLQPPESSWGYAAVGIGLTLMTDLSGSPMIAFRDTEGTTEQAAPVVFQRWNGEVWEQVYSDHTPLRGVVDSPAVALSDRGVPCLAYAVNHSDGVEQIHVFEWSETQWTELTDGTGVGASNSENDSVDPQIAVGPDGHPIVAWRELVPCEQGTNQYESRVHIRRWSGQEWNEIGLGSAQGCGITDNLLSISEFRLALDPSGNPMISWQVDDFDVYLKTATLWHDLPASANGDDVVDIADLVTLMNHLDGSSPILHPLALSNADLNGDGEITQADANALLAMLLGQ